MEAKRKALEGIVSKPETPKPAEIAESSIGIPTKSPTIARLN